AGAGAERRGGLGWRDRQADRPGRAAGPGPVPGPAAGPARDPRGGCLGVPARPARGGGGTRRAGRGPARPGGGATSGTAAGARGEPVLEGEVQNGRTLRHLEQPEGESWTALLPFSRFPDVMSFPEGEPWLHFADSLPFPVEISSRMKLISPAKASKDVGRRLAHARDMDAHIREAGVDLPLALAEQLEAARMLEHGITKERLPFVYGWHRLSVAAPTRELCQRRVEALVEHYRDIGIDVVNSTGDQFSLLRESLPGER